MKKVVYIISDIDKALAFEWTALGLRSKFDLTFILIGRKESSLSIFLRKQEIPIHEVSDAQYHTWWNKFSRIYYLLRQENPDAVHTHLWRANLLGLTTAWLLGIKKRIYTRHHALVHYREHPQGRKWDRLCNLLATHIIAISKNVEEILIDLDKANPAKIHLIHHGFDLSASDAAKREALRVRYNLKIQDKPVIGVISRYVEWKGIQYVIPAFKNLKKEFPQAKLVLANAHGSYAGEIKRLLKELPEDSFVEIEFENDLATLYELFDVFVHVPVDAQVEAFGQTYVEALVAGIPSVFTLSGIAREFIKHKSNAWVVDFEDSEQIAGGIRQILQDDRLRHGLIREGQLSAKAFSLERFILALEKIYAD